MGKICVLRIGHRRNRDQRVTTHVFLAARAFGASEGVLSGDRDEPVLAGIGKVADVWGGGFLVCYAADWRRFLIERKSAGWKVAHLTMYGEDFEAGAKKLGNKNVVVVVGAGKVPGDAYALADYNLAVTNQPHSEISALALFLDRLFDGRGFPHRVDGKLRILPNKCGKVVVRGQNR